MKKILLNSSAIILVAAIIAVSCSKETGAVNKTTTDNLMQTATASPTDSGLICYLPFNKNLKDASGNGNNGTLKGGTITYVNDRFGNKKSAIYFGTSQAYIEIPEKDVDGLTAATFAMEFYPTSSGTTQLLMSKMSYNSPAGSPGFYQSFELGIPSYTNISFSIRQENYCDASDGGWNQPVTSDSLVTLNAWNHVAVTFNNNIQKIYINGKLANINQKTASPICSGEPVRLGIWWAQDPDFFTGSMDEVRIYNRVLDAKEIKQLWSKASNN